MPFHPVFSSRERTEPANMRIVRVATRIYAQSRGPVFRDVGGIPPTLSVSHCTSGEAVETLLFGGPGRGHQRLDETTHERR